MQFIYNTLQVGASEPFTLLHISDTHLTFADNRDTLRKTELAARRAECFPAAERDLAQAAAFAKAENMMIVHTGDLLDFVSAANIEKAKDFTRQNDVFLCAGNHEFSLYVGEAKEDAAYRNQSLAAVQAAFTNDIRFDVRTVNGVKFIAVDNGYYLFEQAQLDALRRECAGEEPVILLLHTPLYCPEVYDFVVKTEGGVPAYLMAVPEQKMAGYSPERFAQQQADAVTLEACEFIRSCNNIKGILAGHIHHDFECTLPNGVPQLITGLSTGRVITVR